MIKNKKIIVEKLGFALHQKNKAEVKKKRGKLNEKTNRWYIHNNHIYDVNAKCIICILY